jgi:hypothetical protein
LQSLPSICIALRCHSFTRHLLLESFQQLALTQQQSFTPKDLHGAHGTLDHSLQLRWQFLFDFCLNSTEKEESQEIVSSIHEMLIHMNVISCELEGSVKGLGGLEDVRVEEVEDGVGLVEIILDGCS